MLLRLYLVHLLIVLHLRCRRLSLFQYLNRIVLLYQYGSFVHPFVPLKSVSITSKLKFFLFSWKSLSILLVSNSIALRVQTHCF